jgi:hypothetical protein
MNNRKKSTPEAKLANYRELAREISGGLINEVICQCIADLEEQSLRQTKVLVGSIFTPAKSLIKIIAARSLGSYR